MWYLRISPKFFLLFLFLLLLIFIVLGFVYADAGYFYNSLMPELTGVAIELIVILLVFNYWQERSKKEKLITIERRLREYLIFFLRHNFNGMPPELKIGRFYGVDHVKNQEALEGLRLYIKNNPLNCSNVEAITGYCKRDCTTIENLLPIAAELTNEHFKSWSRIVFFMNGIAKETNSVEKNVEGIIQNIKRFDNASNNHKLYVGASDV